MPFAQIDIDKEIKKRCNESPKFKKEWEDSQEEYRLIGEMIALRKQEKITQKELAAMTGNKQQVISRIERKDNSPSVKTFSNILKAMGYELQIVKKANVN
jgi:DNA-binding XRE family transcriptional regulator